MNIVLKEMMYKIFYRYIDVVCNRKWLYIYFCHRCLQILLVTLVTLAAAAPEPDHKPLPLVSAAKTPASTAKLRPLGTPIATPLLAPISHLAYAAPAFHHVSYHQICIYY